ncbi:MAG: SixA phosphatase family protein [Kofleriaceae bacterium]
MQLYVIRHAIAEDASPGQDDAQRELTTAGIKKLKDVVRGLRELDLSFERILTSPWRRAAETAELLAPLADQPPILTELLCQSPRAELLAMIAERGETTAVVGHEPWISELIAWLVFGDMRHGEALLLKKAGVVWLEGSAVPSGMMLRAMLPPKFVRQLAQ